MGELRFWYPATIRDITSVNDSFDSCTLSICYSGVNRNGSSISKEVIEKAIPTMSYCPLVANYSVEDDSIGGHDVSFVNDGDGQLKMVNLTDAVGVIPENPEWHWETRVEGNGTEHEYLTTYAVLWKRTPVYEKLKKDGITGQSMEISVREGKMEDGIFVVDDFAFTAFCLLGNDVEPCFEQAQVSMFSMDSIGSRLREMMYDLKNTLISARADDKYMPGENDDGKGGNEGLDLDALLKEFGLCKKDVDFSIDGMNESEIREKFAQVRALKYEGEEETGSSGDGNGEGGSGGSGENGAGGTGTDGTGGTGTDGTGTGGNGTDGTGGTGGTGTDGTGGTGSNGTGGSGTGSNDSDDGDDDEEEPVEDDNEDLPGKRGRFELTAGQLIDELYVALGAVTFTDICGEHARYWYIDHDATVSEVYAHDCLEGYMVGFPYHMNGDKPVIDFDAVKRKKVVFVDYDEGEEQLVYSTMTKCATEYFKHELDALRMFKAETEQAHRKAELADVFARFQDLADDERFIELQEGCGNMSVQDVEDKCFAIRGRKVQMQFSNNNDSKPVKLPVERRNSSDDEPYGGVFLEFGIGK